VNAAQDAAVHQVSRGLFNFTITFFATRHEVASLPVGPLFLFDRVLV
jgi:hypothetical protein